MTGLFARELAGLAFVGALALAPQAGAAPVHTGHIVADLGAEATAIAPGQTLHVVLTQEIQKGWHTYWRNSGDSGEATAIKWTLPAGWTAGDIIWAPPSREPTGPLMNYGYHGQVLLPVAITAPKDARPGQTVTLQADAQFLVCADLCVPEDAKLTLTLPVTATPGGPDPIWSPKIASALAATPKSDGLSAVVSKDAKGLKLAVVGAPLKGLDKTDAYFFPFKSNLIDHAKPQVIDRGPDGLTLTLALPATPPGESEYAQVAGVLELAGKAYEVSAVPGPLPAGASGLGPPAAKASAGTPGGGADMGLLAAVAFAFVGGLILNLMPCVFPILAMKAASLAGHGHDRREAQVQGLAFLAGSVATFLALAGILIVVRTAGAAVGWGFQLQSPPVVATLALLMLAVALNLSGLFEVGSSLQGVGGQAASRGGVLGSFFTGALAVVVAAPCTAPFMGPALGWALTQNPAAALAVFAGLGLGFAAPFTAAAFAPGLLSRLPKPGAWMDGFRKLMSFPMYGTAAWLAWVLTVQTDPTGLARLFAAAIVLALGVWLLGIAQRRQAQGSGPVLPALTGAVLALAALGLAVYPKYDEPSATSSAPEGSAIAFEPYSPEKLAAAQAAGKPVFVNYTAAWCVTCQVNEKVAFSTTQAAQAFAHTGAIYMKADWTRRDAAIAADLAKYGRAGVPLYLVYPARGGQPAILPQILTGDIVAKALEKAAAS